MRDKIENRIFYLKSGLFVIVLIQLYLFILKIYSEVSVIPEWDISWFWTLSPVIFSAGLFILVFIVLFISILAMMKQIENGFQ